MRGLSIMLLKSSHNRLCEDNHETLLRQCYQSTKANSPMNGLILRNLSLRICVNTVGGSALYYEFNM